MAIFGFGKSSNANAPAGADAAGKPAGPREWSPENAQKFFHHAKVAHDSTNYEYAMVMWLRGLQQDPRILAGLTNFFASAAAFRETADGKKGVSKDTAKAVSGREDVDRFLTAVYEFAMKPQEPLLAVKALEGAAKVKAKEAGDWLGNVALKLVAGRPRKDLYVKLKDAFAGLDAWDRAVACAEAAYKLDPSDGPLGAEVRELAAKATMTKGGYDQTGAEGGFRSNIRDAQKQRQLEEAERLSKGEDVKDRVVGSAREELVKRSEDLPTIERYVKALMERARPEDEEEAYALLLKTFERTNQFRFRKAAGDVRIRQQGRRTSEARRAAIEANHKDPALNERMQAEINALLTLQRDEFRLRVEAYPTDLSLRYELGKIYFALNQLEDAIGCFQEAQHDPRTRVETLNLLGQSFLRSDFPDEAIETFRRALASSEILPDTATEVRYNLMCALQAVGESRRDLAAAEEAEKIASSIMIQNISFKDIRARREALKKLVLELRAK